MKLSDYLVQYLIERGSTHTFLVTGGACAHIVDSLGKNKKMTYVCVQHEQAAAMAVDAYSRVSKRLGVAVATSGPGATNLITGMCCLWFDSIPGLFITGQVNTHETKGDRKVRQIGFQETDIVDIVRPITKYAVMVTDPKTIKYHLDKAYSLATSARPGPVLLDIPLNVQHADINPDELQGYVPGKAKNESRSALWEKAHKAAVLLMKAKRPVIIAGMGVKIAGGVAEFRTLTERLGFPVISSWSGIDVLEHTHPLYFGQFGVYGNRAANFIVQNSDTFLSIGSRLDTRQASGQPQTFARAAKKIVVDIDQHELHKGVVKADLPINADAKEFLTILIEEVVRLKKPDVRAWIVRCEAWKKAYPSVLPEYFKQKKYVNPYVFVRTLADELGTGDIIIADEGGNLVWSVQAFHVKKDQQFFSAFAHSPMGYSFPASIGAYFASPKRPIICLDGDGGFQLNIQELQTIRHYAIPVKIFILNNNAYGIIKQFQEVYFDATYTATTNEFGYSAPDFVRVAEAYGIPAVRITNHRDLKKKIRKILKSKGPVLCDVSIDESQKLIPKLIADKTPTGKYISKPLEDMAPFLPRDEFMENMIVEPLPQSVGKKKSSEIN